LYAAKSRRPTLVSCDSAFARAFADMPGLTSCYGGRVSEDGMLLLGRSVASRQPRPIHKSKGRIWKPSAGQLT
jgi:hypothetical protein